MHIYLDMHACLWHHSMHGWPQYSMHGWPQYSMHGWPQYMHGKVHTLIKQSVINGMYIIPHMPHIYHPYIYMCKQLDMDACLWYHYNL